MGQLHFEDGILESQSSILSNLPQTSTKSQALVYSSNYKNEVLESYYRNNCENKIIESQNFVSNFSDPYYFENEVLELQNFQFNSEEINTTFNNRSLLNMYLVDAVNNDNPC
ncbi:22296_t:CDS:2 [Gigaspora margarita]|uniref:22296_t:CDS:1 n=1 Tax=Gigaspora margarita TaxID=4874 RepID=A0ABN7VG88_GIGMA|nr:22296_t:CDS:2 [Gigaspora margarita]